MPLSIGDKLGPYEILAPVRAGGMGEVWRARDTRLDRIVAIKTSSERFSERFDREARAIAALNHPNICQIYDVGPDYLVMEFVDGSALAAVDGTRKLLDLAAQIADGMAAAHGAGIIHRDLKPDNILVTHEGRVKILDFGLAKAPTRDVRPDDATRTIAVTAAGTIVGTVAYMSPEQARGSGDLTVQSDQFSFGLILYELVTGTRPFDRASKAETMAAIIREEAEPLPAGLSAPLRWIIERLLSKEAAERYDSSRDLYRDLRQLRENLSDARTGSLGITSIPGTPARRRIPVMLGIGVACLVMGGLITLLLLPPPSDDVSAYKFSPLSREEAREMQPQWSPDGRSIAYVTWIRGTSQIFTKSIGEHDAAQLTKSSESCSWPFWAADGSSIYYTTPSGLWVVGASGGAPELVLEKVIAASMHPDGRTLAFVRDGKLWVGLIKPGQSVQFGQNLPELLRGTWVKFSPDGEKLAVHVLREEGSNGDFWLLGYPSGTGRILGPQLRMDSASWLPDSRRLVFGPKGEFSILDTANGSVRLMYRSPTGIANPSASPDGKRLAYVAGDFEWDVIEISLNDRSVHNLVAGGGAAWWPDWAPSGTHFLFSTSREGSFAIEDRSLQERFSRRLVDPQGGHAQNNPLWAPDGDRFVYWVASPGGGRLMLSNASRGRITTLDSGVSSGLMAWSPDGQWVAYGRLRQRKVEMAKIHPGSTGAAVVLPSQGLRDHRPGPGGGYPTMHWSPTGEWILYPDESGGFSLISPDGRSDHKLTPRNFWACGFSKDGEQILGVYRNSDPGVAEWQLYTVDTKSGAEKMLGTIDLPPTTDGMAGFSLHPNGKSFLTSIAKWPYDIWMLEGFDQNRTWLDRLLRR